MKRLLLILIIGLLFSCNDDFLDQVPNDRITFEETFDARKNAEQYLANVYNTIYDPLPNGLWLAGSDEAVFVNPAFFASQMNRGDYNAASGEIFTRWERYYRGIRRASTFINNIDNCQDCEPERIDQYVAEARVLRAFFYFRLFRVYGPVVLMGDNPVSPDAPADEFIRFRSTTEENVNYMVSELDEAAASLTDIPFRGNVAGRMSRQFALAVKVKVLMWSASPLLNGNSDYADFTSGEGEQLVPTNYDESKWERAATAAEEFIEEFVPGDFELNREYNDDGSYDPYSSLKEVFTEDWNEEIIYAKPGISSDGHQSDVTPVHSGYPNEVRGSGRLAATQEIVDAYFTSNGRSIDDPEADYQEEGFTQFQAPFDFEERETFGQWANREPRFYVGITYNQSLWLDRNFGDVITTTWYNGNSGRGANPNEYPLTGYIVRKFATNESPRSQHVIRLAEIYLDYVEALNEYDPENPDILEYLNLIRERAGIPEYGSAELETPSDQGEMREAIRKERRVEFAFEQVRYFDGRRWKIAEEAFNGPFHGMDIDARDESNFYNPVEFEERIFNERHYLWPIPQYEINRNPDMAQNPFW